MQPHKGSNDNVQSIAIINAPTSIVGHKDGAVERLLRQLVILI
jgi:hypothetical protein